MVLPAKWRLNTAEEARKHDSFISAGMEAFSPNGLVSHYVIAASSVSRVDSPSKTHFYFSLSLFSSPLPMNNLKNRYRTSDIHDVMEIIRNPSSDYDPEPTTLPAVLGVRAGLIA